MLTGAATSCESGFNEFDNFDYQTVCFATQYAERTLVLGEDMFADNAIDNERKVSIKAAWGGGYDNPENVAISFVVDESLCDNLYFSDEDRPVVPMPDDYYELASDRILIPSGQISGGVEVRLTNAFFADEHATGNCYAIPLRMTAVSGADSILQGKANVADPVLTNSGHWSVQPKNYVIYAIKYVNEWHGEYLRRGTDQITANGTSTRNVRHARYIEDDEVVYVSTGSLTECSLPLTVQDMEGNDIGYNLTLTFGDDGRCTLSSDTEGVRLTGNGIFVKDGEKNSLGGKDRDALYLDYTADFENYGMSYATKDTLVLRTRGVQGGKSFVAELR